jgi:predicted RNA-binding protein YlxR (DUF448 family)
VACRTTRDKRELVRIVRSPDGHVVLDPTGRVPGRGAYLCADGSCWQAALDKNIIARALRVALPDDVRERLRAGAAAQLTQPQGGARGQE